MGLGGFNPYPPPPPTFVIVQREKYNENLERERRKKFSKEAKKLLQSFHYSERLYFISDKNLFL